MTDTYDPERPTRSEVADTPGDTGGSIGPGPRWADSIPEDPFRAN